MKSEEGKTEEKFAIRFGLGGIKAVGFNMMELVINERKENGKFADIYDFAKRADPKNINKKSIEALAKSGAFETLHKNRRQIAESFDILSAYSTEKNNEASSNQMSLFGGLPEANRNPELKKIEDWNKLERLQKEFEAFGFFLSEHPLDDNISDLKKRGVVFSDKFERDEFKDGDIIKIAGVIASSKHRSGSRGRFAYLTISDPFGIFEAMIFDEALITSARDTLADGNSVMLECLIRSDEGGVRVLVRDVKKLNDFIQNTKAQEEDFEDIQKQTFSRSSSNSQWQKKQDQQQNKASEAKQNAIKPQSQILPSKADKKVFKEVRIFIKEREPIFPIKALLSKLQTLSGLEDDHDKKTTRVLFCVMRDNKLFEIELTKKYLIDEVDSLRLRSVDKVIKVEVIQ